MNRQGKSKAISRNFYGKRICVRTNSLHSLYIPTAQCACIVECKHGTQQLSVFALQIAMRVNQGSLVHFCLDNLY